LRKIEKLKAAKIDRSLLQGESFELFSAAIRSPATRDPYERKLLGFLKRINMSPDDFMQFAKDNPSNDESACGTFDTFINQVDAAERRDNDDNTLTADQADELRTQAEEIRDELLLDC
jgi:hypothetical protein